MRFRGGEFSTGTMRNFQPELTLRGMFLRDQEKTLLMRPEAGPDIEIAKTRVLAIEEVKRRSRSLPWRPFECASPSVGRSR